MNHLMIDENIREISFGKPSCFPARPCTGRRESLRRALIERGSAMRPGGSRQDRERWQMIDGKEPCDSEPRTGTEPTKGQALMVTSETRGCKSPIIRQRLGRATTEGPRTLSAPRAVLKHTTRHLPVPAEGSCRALGGDTHKKVWRWRPGWALLALEICELGK